MGQVDAAYTKLALAKVIYPAKLDAVCAPLAVQRANRVCALGQFRGQHHVAAEATTQKSADSSTAKERSSMVQVEDAPANLEMARPGVLNIDAAVAEVKELQRQMKQTESEFVAAALNLKRCNDAGR
jgi:membrane fusion protein (multidrug efflux system)